MEDINIVKLLINATVRLQHQNTLLNSDVIKFGVFRSFVSLLKLLIADFLIIGRYVFDLSISDVGSFLLRIELKQQM